jgi:hypothetical protein
MAAARNLVRQTLIRLGERASDKQLANLRSALSYLEIGRWLDGDRPRRVSDEFALFEVACQRVRGRHPLYLEFGVFEGRSMRWWAEHLTQPEARLVGFDSFEGLPVDWRPGLPAGHFATGGPPSIDDPRVTFEVGWFEKTLPQFAFPEHDQLIVNVDCDLYSSAAEVLTAIEPYLRRGSLIYFDEFPDRDHELRAFTELRERVALELRPIAFAHGGVHWLFEVC